jgi:hypothetical protein
METRYDEVADSSGHHITFGELRNSQQTDRGLGGSLLSEVVRELLGADCMMKAG